MRPLLPPSPLRAVMPRCVKAVCLAVLLTVLTAFAPWTAVRAAEPVLTTGDTVPDVPAKPAVPSDDPAVQARPPGCAVWTDSCVTCERQAGQISCSNIGIACQPQAVECVRTDQADDKKPDGDRKDN